MSLTRKLIGKIEESMLNLCELRDKVTQSDLQGIAHAKAREIFDGFKTEETLKVLANEMNLNELRNANQIFKELLEEVSVCEHSWIDKNNDGQQTCRKCGEIND